jgi:hypothetical protein
MHCSAATSYQRKQIRIEFRAVKTNNVNAGDRCKPFSVISEPPGEVRDRLTWLGNMQGE